MAIRFNRLAKFVVTVTIWHLAAVAWAADNPKRVPSGFTGVRGKKSLGQYEDTGERSSEVYQAEDRKEDSNEVEEDAIQEYQYKRGPMGFVGMRGKKEPSHAFNYQDDLYREIQKLRFNCKLFPDSYRCDEFKDIDSNEAGEDREEPYFGRSYEVKRAPSGFMGMRGKKFTDDTLYLKRAPSGFMGMRGKKSLQILEDPESDEVGYMVKRAPAAGFFGMRGKKMPGNSGFFGMRGKKGPFDYPFRGKFVGVRGKKSIYGGIENQIEGSTARLD